MKAFGGYLGCSPRPLVFFRVKNFDLKAESSDLSISMTYPSRKFVRIVSYGLVYLPCLHPVEDGDIAIEDDLLPVQFDYVILD